MKIREELSMNYIRITDENIEKEHICCAMSGKQGVIKKEWLKQRFKEGLVFCRSVASALLSIFRRKTRGCLFRRTGIFILTACGSPAR